MKHFILSSQFEKLVTAVIFLNAITLGLETSKELMASYGSLLVLMDQLFLAFFCFEIFFKILFKGKKYFQDPWSYFDILTVGVSLIPAAGNLSVLRAFRILRTLRMISILPRLRKVVTSLLQALPGLSSVGLILSLIFYVFSVMATKLFRDQFPDWFGSIPESAYSLFQIMTLESWSMGIVRPVMEVFPWAWAFFVPFILIATFVMLNLFIAVIVGAAQAETEQAAQERAEQGHQEREEILRRLKSIEDILREKSNHF